jgi:hypothetical protein
MGEAVETLMELTAITIVKGSGLWLKALISNGLLGIKRKLKLQPFFIATIK